MAFLRYLFHESEFKRFEQQFPHLQGFVFVKQVLVDFYLLLLESNWRVSSISTLG